MGLIISGSLFICVCCSTTSMIFMACVVYQASKSGHATIITTTTLGGPGTAIGAQSGTVDQPQPGFQLQNLGI